MTLLEATALEATIAYRIKALIHEELGACKVIHVNEENQTLMDKNSAISEENLVRALERMLP